MAKHRPYGIYEKYIKRPQDFLCALLAIIVLSPVMIVTAILVRIKLGSPVLFTQEGFSARSTDYSILRACRRGAFWRQVIASLKF